MALALRQWLGSNAVTVRIAPFLSLSSHERPSQQRQWDFAYIADGQAHKNHRRLVEAWIVLAEWGLRPSLVLTLSERDRALRQWIKQQATQHGLQITDVGQVDHAAALQLYYRVEALIYPSLSESFALPLVEARNFGLPIVAGELDYVRDVCVPGQSFNPLSSVSIARAVMRFLGLAVSPVEVISTRQFLEAAFAKDLPRWPR